MRHPTTRRPSAPVAREARRRARREARRRRREKDARATWSTRGRARASPRKTSSRAVSVPRGVRARRDSRTPRTPDGARSRVGGGSVKRPRRRVVPSARLAAPASNRDRGLIGLTRDRPVKRVDSESGDLNRKQTALFRSAVHRKTPRFFPASDNNFPRDGTQIRGSQRSSGCVAASHRFSLPRRRPLRRTQARAAARRRAKRSGRRRVERTTSGAGLPASRRRGEAWHRGETRASV